MKQAQGARFIASFAKKPALSEVKGWGFGSCGIWLVWDLARVGFARVGRTLLSVAFDVDLDPDFDFDFDREGHGFSRAATRRQKRTRLQPLKETASNKGTLIPNRAPSPVRNLLVPRLELWNFEIRTATLSRSLVKLIKNNPATSGTRPWPSYLRLSVKPA
jgi:hypothetical protein